MSVCGSGREGAATATATQRRRGNARKRAVTRPISTQLLGTR